jgi:hypothetical protein
MITEHIYSLGDLKFTIIDEKDTVNVSYGKKSLSIPLQDLLEFARTLVINDKGLPTVQDFKPVLEHPTKPQAPSRPRRTDVPPLEDRKADSSAPLKQFTREDLARMDAPIKDPNVRFETVDMKSFANEAVRFGS